MYWFDLFCSSLKICSFLYNFFFANKLLVSYNYLTFSCLCFLVLCIILYNFNLWMPSISVRLF